ncbi:MAG: divergent PAP2 family protein [Anaerolineaceae bacterium]|nr:divergent PAP2 family protein [Anaerolineaceae bacterium]MBN2677111.1 divergent PAP2 family protein [Anaerolineaceae bacterium]
MPEIPINNNILGNSVLITALVAWTLAQILKLPAGYIRAHQWQWSLIFSAGGMPSSHSALISATTLAIGLFHGFGSPLFALALAIGMIVVYDAAGIRHQAGKHAQKINLMIDALFQGHPVSDTALKEVLGHTPLEALMGVVLGSIVAVVVWVVLR